ncbi:unnamed protein product [Didymodactylos carnosus]|uniref:NAD(P)(+)--arginine ADP-ribosyltransferase n=1 Tax=Didymodactylos carnosus TaxID=1234261 RepID=A0A8S2KSM2_9BILA|nr:unnamed protein product [Didymodactylos carnosus]CAF3866497.1 unnamed protein product [Didymodactylos carnosus]
MASASANSPSSKPEASKPAFTTSTSAVATAPVLLRLRNFQWYWNSSADPWSSSTGGSKQPDDAWKKYTDVENEIIEDAYNLKKVDVELDGNYIINFKHQVQYNKSDKTRQRQIKRAELVTDRSNVHLREERFSLPITVANTTNNSTEASTTTADSETEEERLLQYLRRHGDLSKNYRQLELRCKGKTYADVVGDAASGILAEGIKLGKVKEAQWLAKQLLDVKQFGEDKLLDLYDDVDIPQPIGETCVYLYTKESFWYKHLNSVLRNYPTMTLEQVKTLGPFCFILFNYIHHKSSVGEFTVYRGLTVTDEERQQFLKTGANIIFTSFTSTSRSRKLAERFGNTLLIFNLDVKNIYGYEKVKIGMDVSSLSDFPNEEEFTVWAGAAFHLWGYEYDNEAKKHVIYLSAAPYQQGQAVQRQFPIAEQP